jgi:hypothetical protein
VQANVAFASACQLSRPPAPGWSLREVLPDLWQVLAGALEHPQSLQAEPQQAPLPSVELCGRAWKLKLRALGGAECGADGEVPERFFALILTPLALDEPDEPGAPAGDEAALREVMAMEEVAAARGALWCVGIEPPLRMLLPGERITEDVAGRGALRAGG